MTTHFLFFLFVLIAEDALLAAEYAPWGKDADLMQLPKKNVEEQESVGFSTIIAFHQKVISQADGPRSHYYPSSSQYMLQAVKKYGFFTGFTYGCDRLLRENSDPWLYPIMTTKNKDHLKLDPVP